jgi:hypothetical protein
VDLDAFMVVEDPAILRGLVRAGWRDGEGGHAPPRARSAA